MFVVIHGTETLYEGTFEQCQSFAYMRCWGCSHNADMDTWYVLTDDPDVREIVYIEYK